VPCAHTPEGRRAAAVRVAVPHDVHSDVGLVVGVTVVGVAGCARCLPVARELRVVEGCPPLGDEWRLRGLDGRQPLARPQPVAGARAQVTMTRLSRTRLSNDLVVLDPRTGEVVRRIPGSAIPIRSASAPTGDGSWPPRCASTGWTSIASTVRSSRWLRASPWGGHRATSPSRATAALCTPPCRTATSSWRSISTWIYRITMNTALNKRRGKRSEVEVFPRGALSDVQGRRAPGGRPELSARRLIPDARGGVALGGRPCRGAPRHRRLA
jgi:hypothetical protein